MKKKIAVFANGWSNEYLELVLEGAKNRAAEDNIDLFVFLNYSSGSESDPGNVGESMIFSLPNIADFDAVLLMGNTINMAYERKELREKILKYKIPAISLEYPMQDIPYIGTDTYQGIYNLMLHVLEVHHAHDFIFVSGPRSNQESESRKRAVEDALETAGLVLREENIIEADWSYFVSYDKTIEYVNTHDKLPDAIVCANDEMAIGVCAALDFMKVRVPDDVIVTGCDYLRRGQDFFPILSTVGREWDKLGYQGMDMLIQQMNGAEIPMNTVLQSTPIIGESCGCNVSLTKSDERLHSIIANYRVQREDTINEWQLRYIDELFSKKNSVDGLKESMRNTFQDNHSFEGEDFMLCIVDRYFEEKESWEELKLGELTERMDVYVNLVGGKAVITDKFPTKDLLPYYDGNTEETQVYLFVPLNTKVTSIGYMVQKNNLKRVYEQNIYVWLRRVSQDLERVKQNIRVEELNKKLKEVSITDALTGLRNRTGFDVLALPCLLECQKQGKHSAIVFADVNQMKMINDKHGHLQGDLALCTVAEAIKKALPENWVAVRYGGDEFLMVGECRDAQDAEEITENLRVELETLKSKRRLNFNLSVSIGSVVMYPEENNNLEEYLRRADEAMYVAKQYFHETQASLI
ncbi:MAG: GGDEF domain-containing protein [Lachnospiraceae bacterium]|nr:GGDEF domain-containing protein [Lachnospiraceae bacterium]